MIRRTHFCVVLLCKVGDNDGSDSRGVPDEGGFSDWSDDDQDAELLDLPVETLRVFIVLTIVNFTAKLG